MRAAIYARISRDSEATGLGVERQISDCKRLIAQRGWEPSGEFIDNDISAARKNGRLPERPSYDAMLEAIKRGEVDAVVGWDLDRIHRDPFEAEQFYLLAEQYHLQRLTTPGD